jgi:GntR family transcriptional regulator
MSPHFASFQFWNQDNQDMNLKTKKPIQKKIDRPYQRLQVELEKIISITKPGGRLISEPDLSRQLGVSRATLREAMRAFENQGLIRRQQGIGTFVVGQTQVIDNGLEVLESIESRAQKIKLKVTMGALDMETIKTDEKISEELGVEIGTEVLRVRRVMYTDNRPIAFLEDILPHDILTPSDLKEGFTGSVLDLLIKRGNPSLSQSKTNISATAASPEMARALQIQRSDVLLSFQAQLFDQNNRVIDYSISHFLPGYFRFHVVRRVGSANSNHSAR